MDDGMKVLAVVLTLVGTPIVAWLIGRRRVKRALIAELCLTLDSYSALFSEKKFAEYTRQFEDVGY
jgi:hypothetical protein